MPSPKAQEIPLKQWAKANDVPYRTAISWANETKIPAKRKQKKVKVFAEKTVVGYYIMSNATKPGSGKQNRA